MFLFPGQFLFRKFDDGHGFRAGYLLPALAGLSGKSGRFEVSRVLFNTTAPLLSLPGVDLVRRKAIAAGVCKKHKENTRG